ncbi:MAG TPA: hypothetical protein DCL44_10835 [Elusimicrobia bacterium]|nr:hypothetical protein [Elusimicrobiota bacterium]
MTFSLKRNSIVILGSVKQFFNNSPFFISKNTCFFQEIKLLTEKSYKKQDFSINGSNLLTIVDNLWIT